MDDAQSNEFQKYLLEFTKKSGKKLSPRTIKTAILLSKYFPAIETSESLESLQQKCSQYLQERSYPIARYSLWLYLSHKGYSDRDIKEVVRFETKSSSALTDDEKLAKSVLKKDELLKLIGGIENRRDNLIVRLLYDTACRVSELCNVKLQDVGFENNEMQVLGKGSKPRTVYFHDETSKMLKNWVELNQINDADTVFPIKPITVWYNIKKHGRNILDKELHPHMFRHTRLQHMADVGVDGLSIKAYAGHEDVRTTQIYVKSSKFQRKLAFEKAGNVWGADEQKEN